MTQKEINLSETEQDIQETEIKVELETLYLDLSKTISNIKAAAKSVDNALSYIVGENSSNYSMRVNIAARSALITGLSMTMQSLTNLCAVAETSLEPCLQMVPELANKTTVQ